MEINFGKRFAIAVGMFLAGYALCGYSAYHSESGWMSLGFLLMFVDFCVFRRTWARWQVDRDETWRCAARHRYAQRWRR